MAVVAWPPPTPPNNRANAAVQLDQHPLDHIRTADALDTIIARLGALPIIRYGTITPTFASGAATYTLAGAAGTPLSPFPIGCDGLIAIVTATSIGIASTTYINSAGPLSASQLKFQLTTTFSGALAIYFWAWGR